ncbi:MAG: alkaline phosphatase family protein [Candidatus Eisenbacteria sp.]|nr:alkaline phosphatase family protein [Candidatus Eisenbacteria bacterium]
MTDDHPEQTSGKRVMVVGLDGATWERLTPWIRAGYLPNLERLVDEGASGRLRTVVPPVTAPAWTTFMTGLNPGRHGVFEFIVRLQPDFHEVPVNATLRDGIPVWTLLSDEGRKVIVVNVPVTYPPEAINGIQISGFLTPRGRRDFTHPPEILDELEAELGPYELYHGEVYRPGAAGAVLDELYRVFDYRLRVAKSLAGKKDWDFFMVHFWGVDRAQHELWHLGDPEHPAYDVAEGKKHGQRLIDYYSRVDRGLGELREEARRRGAVFLLMSDHGFGPITRFFMPNVWLMEQGFLVLRSDPVTSLKKLAFRAGLTPAAAYRMAMRLGLAKMRLSGGFSSRKGLVDQVQRIFLSLSDVDWNRTRVFSKGNYGQFYVNLKGREPYGTVEPGDEYEAVRDHVIDRLKATPDPESGEPFFGEVYRREEIYDGPYVDLAPDVVYLPADMSAKALGTLDFSSNRFIESTYGNSGDHRMEGIMAVAGDPIRAGHRIEGATIMDLAPTILYMMDCPVPRAMDGRVLTSLFEPGAVRERPVQFSDRELVRGIGGGTFSEEENEAIRKHLRGVGYVG